jgi:hypothetical protein
MLQAETLDLRIVGAQYVIFRGNHSSFARHFRCVDLSVSESGNQLLSVSCGRIPERRTARQSEHPFDQAAHGDMGAVHNLNERP